MTWFRSKPRLKDPVKHYVTHRSASPSEADPIIKEISAEFRRMQNQTKESTNENEPRSNSPDSGK